MKSYSLELVQRKTGGGFGKLAAVALIGAGAYLGYKQLKQKPKTDDFTQSQMKSIIDEEAVQGESFTARILKAAKKVID